MENNHSDLRLDHQTLRDDTLTHQVRFSMVRRQVSVSCNCRATTGKHEKAGKIIYSSMGFSSTIEESRRLYNDPANHWAPFSEGDKAKW